MVYISHNTKTHQLNQCEFYLLHFRPVVLQSSCWLWYPSTPRCLCSENIDFKNICKYEFQIKKREEQISVWNGK